ncbi:hypothetical protein EI42_02685 [Thermosporothrix hazakensis]|jgi:CHASE2 domain-containing sensor protein|uniref:Uncharacterized protein n=2 Tax=Thermosporothrix TaxID=768650 RepID=A0A326U612_THEHA|nr:hypothetical protein [Thermosporothrix hazakensis]PZW29391.1 hypothetical protein EI42_02685 [Thermosporothrix hazakensis]BBH85677.1 hypothetical protein KTC_04280 [Thermosporothrix sp. COM3]GCE45895.1 hypothetical protein KTH_07640 [Thermosporothrix hazakensis]
MKQVAASVAVMSAFLLFLGMSFNWHVLILLSLSIICFSLSALILARKQFRSNSTHLLVIASVLTIYVLSFIASFAGSHWLPR